MFQHFISIKIRQLLKFTSRQQLFKAATLLIVLATAMQAEAQEFSQWFTDSTLRVNCTLAGNATEQHIFVDNMSRTAGWYGRRSHLSEYPVEGNTQFELKDRRTGQVIYRNSLSTLFQEWQSYPEAEESSKSFENVILMPVPKDTADLYIYMKNNRREVSAQLKQTIAPGDILISRLTGSHAPYDVLQHAADTTHCINIAFLAEGYTEGEMQKFTAEARQATEAIFSHEPFKTYRQRFNVVAVKTPSQDSGTSVPSKGEWKHTAVGAHFDTFYSDRYLTTLNVKQVHDLLHGVPYEHIIILVNTDKYGGGGILNFFNLVSTGHKQYEPVVVHEFGHSFAGLADEYAYEFEQIPMYPHDVEPWEANITTLTDFHGKWENLIAKGTPCPTPTSEKKKVAETRVGLFEGAGYSMKGVYRGVQDCRMRTNQCPQFCAVCRAALEKLIKFYTE